MNVHLNDMQDCSQSHKGKGSIKVSNQLTLFFPLHFLKFYAEVQLMYNVGVIVHG